VACGRCREHKRVFAWAGFCGRDNHGLRPTHHHHISTSLLRPSTRFSARKAHSFRRRRRPIGCQRIRVLYRQTSGKARRITAVGWDLGSHGLAHLPRSRNVLEQRSWSCPPRVLSVARRDRTDIPTQRHHARQLHRTGRSYAHAVLPAAARHPGGRRRAL
jgi:hypothetical protein